MGIGDWVGWVDGVELGRREGFFVMDLNLLIDCDDEVFENIGYFRRWRFRI